MGDAHTPKKREGAEGDEENREINHRETNMM
jgi:hypothetical protein